MDVDDRRLGGSAGAALPAPAGRRFGVCDLYVGVDGGPKGVAVTHGGCERCGGRPVDGCGDYRRVWGVAVRVVELSMCRCGSMWWALLCGAAVVVVPGW